jgi:allantoin racemase
VVERDGADRDVADRDRAVDRRIAFINPFGTAAFDTIIKETLVPYAARGTSVDVVHLEGAPVNIDYYYPMHLMQLAIWDEVRRCEAAGYDAVVVGCCYDPGVRVAREMVDIPVVGPLEAAMNHASYFGHSFTVVTDHAKARPWLEDLVRIHGAGNCRGVRCIDWYVTDMIQDTTAVADDAAAACLTALSEDQAEVVILGCTIIGGCLEREIMTTGRHRDLPILNPNLLALKTAETLADLFRQGKYNISRVGLYQKHEQHDPAEAEDVLRRYHLVDRGVVEAGP